MTHCHDVYVRMSISTLLTKFHTDTFLTFPTPWRGKTIAMAMSTHLSVIMSPIARVISVAPLSIVCHDATVSAAAVTPLVYCCGEH